MVISGPFMDLPHLLPINTKLERHVNWCSIHLKPHMNLFSFSLHASCGHKYAKDSKNTCFFGVFFVWPGPPLRLYLDIFHISIIIKNKHANLDDDSKKYKFSIAFPVRLGAQNPRFWTILPLEVPILARY